MTAAVASQPWHFFCTLDALLPGEFQVREIDGLFVAVYNISGDFYGIEDVCTHDGGELAGGPIEGTVVECIRHGAKFDLKSGAALCAPAYASVPVWDVRVVEQRVEVRLKA
jgi:3-phenylpropionate/trans-cinnamate dioxygenase ferredoxin component